MRNVCFDCSFLALDNYGKDTGATTSSLKYFFLCLTVYNQQDCQVFLMGHKITFERFDWTKPFRYTRQKIIFVLLALSLILQVLSGSRGCAVRRVWPALWPSGGGWSWGSSPLRCGGQRTHSAETSAGGHAEVGHRVRTRFLLVSRKKYKLFKQNGKDVMLEGGGTLLSVHRHFCRFKIYFCRF